VPTEHEELPDRLRVHSLARVLGTTSKRVLDALTELDGRARSAHSSVDRVEAVRVRDLLGSVEEPTAEVGPDPGESTGVPDEPESRLLLETAPEAVGGRADYMPLFVAPQPVAFERPAPRDDDDASDDDDDLGSDGDDDNEDRPASRRRRRGRRGRGRGRGSEGANSDEGADSDDDTEDDDSAA
jgi:ribonuclease E